MVCQGQGDKEDGKLVPQGIEGILQPSRCVDNIREAPREARDLTVSGIGALPNKEHGKQRG